ncbi:MAG TPA: penicillin-binding protein 1C [Cytophagales bacterium]|jgi:penicillin-binding protein 1C|nr:penicillin-binding protein 1C [Cytophagales bacterium]
MIRFLKRKKYYLIAFIVIMITYYFCLPNPLFRDSYSTVLNDRQGELLSATIAKDGQWRFPESDSVPKKFAEALITFEDKRFWNHPGVDVLSLGRALRQNLNARKIVSGGSTISMQLIRLSRKGKARTFFEKSIEIILATRLELSYSKNEILAMYASHAPFGGNVVGLEAACWRYFGRDGRDLSWAESAMLAVLPNSPSLIHLGKNREALKIKRDKLLDQLMQIGKIDSHTCELAKAEPVPQSPLDLPRYAHHLLVRAMKEGQEQTKVVSTLQLPLQMRIEQVVQDHHQLLKVNQIFNAAAIVIEVNSGNVLAYVGNTSVKEKGNFSEDVDVINAPRSTGSILKPFLYAAMLDEGKILPQTLLPDIPTFINGFAPQNFSKEFDGAVHADQALIRSLNIPAVHLLKQYRYEKFHSLLKNIGMSTLNNPPEHYGLSLILGGAEGTLWDIAGMYASMARVMNNYFEHPGRNRYDKKDFHAPNYFLNLPQSKSKNESSILEENSYLSAASIYLTFDALKEVYRPSEESGWKYFTNSKTIAWKTGTSFGFRDGWAVGVTPRYVVGVWVGNADGEGRPGLTGTETAAPIMFNIFSQLHVNEWFQQPKPEMSEITVCSSSGQRNSSLCQKIDTVWVANSGLQTSSCAYHKKIHLSADQKFQVNSSCEPMEKMVEANWFVLPPVQEFYFRHKNLSYKTLPPFKKECRQGIAFAAMELIYPKPNSHIFVPRDLNGSVGSIVMEMAHHNPTNVVYWHLDGKFIGTTKHSHQLSITPSQGEHKLILVDESGEFLEGEFDVISNH